MKLYLYILTFALLPSLCLAKAPGSGPTGGQQGRQLNRTALQDLPDNGIAGETTHAGISTLYQFLSLDDEALKQMEDTIRRIRQMSPDERAALRDRILQFQQMPAEERQHIQQAWGRLDSSVRAAWRSYMMGLEPTERDSIRLQLHSIPPESRTKWRMDILEEAGLLDTESTEAKP